MIQTNLVELAESIGSYLAWTEEVNQKTYMNQLLNAAYGEALEEFHRSVAAGGKQLAHMYEYGTVPFHEPHPGIPMLNPMDGAARLWVDIIEGRGQVKDISFQFRPATVRNPKKIGKDYGVAQNVLDNLMVNRGKKYVFTWRARVTELGQEVTVTPKKPDRKIFVPTDIEGDQGGVKGGPGFQWADSSTWSPGDSQDPNQPQAGSFSAFFAGYWAGTGAEIMARSMERNVSIDVKRAEKIIQKEVKNKVLPAGTSLASYAAAAGNKFRKQWTIRIREHEDYPVLERGEMGDIVL
jgi:hypothetical protein